MKIYKSKDEAYAANVDKAVSRLLERALVHGASDVHIEPRERTVVVRFRVNGWLQEVAKLPLPSLDAIIQNLKQRASLNPDLINAPQRGSFRFESENIEVDIQVATMPTVGGETLTLHLSRHLGEAATLEELGFWGESLKRIEMTIAEPHGLVVAASPDNTGATMTMLGMVHLLNSPALNVMTLEESIDHHLPGISQTQLNTAAGVTFSTGLKALLNQDPNVVMVSHLHEADTVRTAVQAALSGRLILGGVHLSDAARGVAHVLTLSHEPFLVASSLRLAIGQRFVRRLCEHCREQYEPTESVRKELRQLLKASGVTSVKALHQLELAAAKADMGAHAASTTEKAITRLFKASPDGCPQCYFTGYKGRLGVCETLRISDAMQKLLAQNPSVAEIRKLAIKEGMIPLPLDGLVKALRGLTTLEQIVPLALGT